VEDVILAGDVDVGDVIVLPPPTNPSWSPGSASPVAASSSRWPPPTATPRKKSVT